MKTMYDFSKEFQAGLVDLHKECGFDALCQEMTKRIEQLKSEILIAWYAEHGFAPAKAVMVEDQTQTGFKVYIRESTAEETEITLATANREKARPCAECVHPEAVETMLRWGWIYCPACSRKLKT